MVSCTLGMLLCDIFYAGSKIVIYGWLIERIHLVTAVKTSRLRTCQYRIHLLMLCPYGIILALMVKKKKKSSVRLIVLTRYFSLSLVELPKYLFRTRWYVYHWITVDC